MIISNYLFYKPGNEGEFLSMSGLKLELDALMPKRFVDRDDLRNTITCSIEALLGNANYHEIIAIYGMGGIGKSRFLNEIKGSFVQAASMTPELIYATLELDNDNDFHSLLCIRRKIMHTCYLFDYAFALLLDRCLIEKVSDDFLNHLQTNWLTDLITLLQGAAPVPLPSLNDGINVLTELINKAIRTGTKLLYGDTIHKLEFLSDTSPKKLLSLLPTLLGCDFHRMASDKKLVVILDACNGCETWLDNLLSEAKAGLFILTSREQLRFSRTNVKPYHMQEIPAPEAKKYLESYINGERYRSVLIPQLILATECIPIYLDLAVSTYLRCEKGSSQDLINELSINNKDALVKAFLDHLSNEQQEVILVLAVVGVFDANIFEHLVSDLNLSVSKLSYHELCKISLVDGLNANCGQKTFHNIFCRNVSKIVSQEEKRRIFRSYLLFLSSRGLYMYPNEVLRIYFANILNVVMDNGFELTVQENEEILDLFFSLRDQRIELAFPNTSQGMLNNALFTFLSAVKMLHSDVAICVAALNTVRGSINLLGKHRNSYYAVQYYSMCIEGQYSRAKRNLAAICDTLAPESISDWYYGKLKIYLADCLMLTGDFREAIIHFDEYYSEVESYASIKENDIFEIQKQKGHCYRFNFLLDKALQVYLDLYNKYASSLVMRSYCLTCLCETKCFFDPQYVISHRHESLAAVRSAGQERSRAKIYYSLGISYTVTRNFPNALHCIRESIKLNGECHYPAGKLFALIAKSYYYYAKSGYVPKSLLQDIVKLSEQLEVYEYLLLPVYLMMEEEKQILRLKETYHWLDWDRTQKNYKEFINSLSRWCRQ